MAFLETERLILRKFREEDFADYCEFAMDTERCRMMGTDFLPDIDAARLTFNWLMGKDNRYYCIVYRENQKVIGYISIHAIPSFLENLKELEGKRGLSLSFCISRSYQRRGLMYEALLCLMDYLFNVEGLDYINCGYFDFNTPSRLLQEKLGFSWLATNTFSQNDEEITAIDNILWKDKYQGMSHFS